jgi:hypothetical protein
MLKKCDKCAEHDRIPAAEYQDKKYGKGIRVHNPCGGKNRDKVRCTVCGEMRGY